MAGGGVIAIGAWHLLKKRREDEEEGSDTYFRFFTAGGKF